MWKIVNELNRAFYSPVAHFFLILQLVALNIKTKQVLFFIPEVVFAESSEFCFPDAVWSTSMKPLVLIFEKISNVYSYKEKALQYICSRKQEVASFTGIIQVSKLAARGRTELQEA